MLTTNQIHDEVDRYRERLDELYGEIRRWIASRCPNAVFSMMRIPLSEEATGVYEVESLEVAIPGKPAVRFVPRGIFMVGARGRVDARSRLGREILVWLEPGGPALRVRAGTDEEVEQVISRPLFQNVSGGWAWSDSKRNQVPHLDEAVFWDRVMSSLTR